MTTDHELEDDPRFEQDLTARLGAAAEPVTGAGVTMASVEARVAERRPGRRRRRGAVALAAAAVVVLGGVGLAAAVNGGEGPPERTTALASEGDPTGLEAPTAEPCAPTTMAPTTVAASGEDAGEQPTTVAPDVEGTGPTTEPSPSEPCVPPTTEGPAPSTTPPPTTSTDDAPDAGPPPTTTPAAWPGAGCEPGSHDDCIDPEGDGTFVWLIGGADCMASQSAGPACADRDGDGHAG